MSTTPPTLAIDPGARRVLRQLHAAGHRAVLAGGCVRDLLLGRVPADWDVATDAEPRQVLALFARTVAVGARFGIVRVVVDEGEYEVARFRREGPYSDGRHPDDVAFATPEEDARRRDFTMNGMFIDVDGEGLIDYVGGRRDLEAGVVRAIGEPAARFAEDGLRTLRAVRFAARFGFRIEEDTWAALRGAAPGIDRVSAERIRDELTRILTEGGAARGLDLLDETGLLERLLPEVSAMKGVAQPPEHHPEGDVFTHVRRMLALVDALPAPPSPALAWGVLLHDVGKPPTFRVADRIRFHGHDAVGADLVEAIARRLRFSNRERDRVRGLTAQHMRIRNVRDMRPGKLKRFLRDELFPELLELHRLDCLGSHGLLDLYDYCRQALGALAAAAEAEGLRPAPLLSGADLTELGYAPGPRFGEILSWVEDEQLDGRLTSRQEARAAVEARWPRAD